MNNLKLEQAMEFIPTRIRPIKDLHSFNLLEVPDKTSGRNDRTWSYGVFAEKHYPDDWENKVVKYNPIFNQPPLDEKELLSTVIKSIRKKKYSGDDPECFDGHTKYNHSEILEIVRSEDWTTPEEEI